MPVVRPTGRCLVVANGQCQPQPLAVLRQMGFEASAVDDPYSAMIELVRRPLVYRALVLSLQSLYREELTMIATVKRRLPHLEVWMTQASGREAALIEAMRLGADGLLDDEGFHRTGTSTTSSADVAPQPIATPAREELERQLPADETSTGEPVLTADELRALLQEQPANPGNGE
jgi:hypothetical protein